MSNPHSSDVIVEVAVVRWCRKAREYLKAARKATDDRETERDLSHTLTMLSKAERRAERILEHRGGTEQLKAL